MSEVVNFPLLSLFSILLIRFHSLRTRCKRPSSVLPVCSVLHLFQSYSFLSSRYFSLFFSSVFYRSFSLSLFTSEKEREREKREREILSSFSNSRRQFNVKVMVVKQKAIYECDQKKFFLSFASSFQILIFSFNFFNLYFFFVFLLSNFSLFFPIFELRIFC